VMGAERIAVMAALNVAHELLSLKLGAGFDLGQAKRRLVALESQIDAAIAKQEKLF
jgi:cell division protein ZapA